MNPDHAIHALCGAPAGREPVVIKKPTLAGACLKAQSNGTTMPDE
jgi:hypothetical protein